VKAEGCGFNSQYWQVMTEVPWSKAPNPQDCSGCVCPQFALYVCTHYTLNKNGAI